MENSVNHVRRRHEYEAFVVRWTQYERDEWRAESIETAAYALLAAYLDALETERRRTVQQECRELDGTLMDGLDEEPWNDELETEDD